jgi:hypothetical protein
MMAATNHKQDRCWLGASPKDNPDLSTYTTSFFIARKITVNVSHTRNW